VKFCEFLWLALNLDGGVALILVPGSISFQTLLAAVEGMKQALAFLTLDS
jgi:hypothetical protein